MSENLPLGWESGAGLLKGGQYFWFFFSKLLPSHSYTQPDVLVLVGHIQLACC